MAKCVTIMPDEDLLKKLNDIQSRQIKDTKGTVIFSQVVNQALGEGLKKK